MCARNIILLTCCQPISYLSCTEIYNTYFFVKFPLSPFSCLCQVMLAASYWSLLAPAIDMAEDSGKYGSFAFLPVAVGFALGAAFVYFADLAMPLLVRTCRKDSLPYSICCTENCKNSVCCGMSGLLDAHVSLHNHSNQSSAILVNLTKGRAYTVMKFGDRHSKLLSNTPNGSFKYE